MKWIFVLACTYLLVACGSDDSSDKDKAGQSISACDFSKTHVDFRDDDLAIGKVGGQVTFIMPENCPANYIQGRWVDAQGNQTNDEIIGANITNQSSSLKALTIPYSTVLPTDAFLQLTAFIDEKSKEGVNFSSVVPVMDLTSVTGPGGNQYLNWVYGVDRPALTVKVRSEGSDHYCQFDNGRVLVHDANFETDASDTGNQAVIADDQMFPAYEFDCTDSRVNEHRKVTTYDNEGSEIVHTYSMINDSMFYGSLVFDMYETLLGKRPMEKIRIRAHYGSLMSFNLWAHWDGAYVNLNDVIYRAYGSASLDTISHEITHGILQTHTALKIASEVSYHMDGRMLHEAFSDMASVMAHYYLYGELNWISGDENFSSRKRFLDKIETENGAIASYFDYNDATTNYYKRMGMMTYPFYQLTQKWGIESAFSLFLEAAQSCWQPDSEIMHAANCVHQTAKINGYSESDVIEAFRAVKIQLSEEDTLAHYEFTASKLRVQFTDDTHSDRVVTDYFWEFGDGQTSTDASPYHEYAEAGKYQPKLKVTDHLGVIDTFARTLDITDQYCSPITSTLKRQFNTVVINEIDIPFDLKRYDYSDMPPIEVTAGVPFSLMVEGQVLDTQSPQTRWSVRVDLNDDGEYSEMDGELLLEYDQFDNEYGLNDSITIDSEYIGQTVYMRLNGDTFKGFSACQTILGSVVELRLKVVAP